MTKLIQSRQHSLKILSLIFAAAVLLSLNCGANEEPELVDLRVPVQVEDVKRGDIEEYVSVTGTLMADKEFSIQTEVNGWVTLGSNSATGSRFKKGESIKKDELIAQIRNKEYEYQTRLMAQEKELEYSTKEFEKTKLLVEKGGAAVREMQNAEKAMINAEFNLKQARLQLSKLKTYSPIDGIIANLKEFTDNTYLPAGTELCKVLSFYKTYIDLNVTNDDISKVSVGQPVKVTNYSLEDQVFFGAVESISPDIDPVTRTFGVRVTMDNSDLKLKPGMFVKADIVAKSKKNTIIIPKYLILNRNNQDIIFVIDKQEAVMREVEIGLDDGENVEILSGLSENERVVSRGFETLKDNTKVRVSQ